MNSNLNDLIHAVWEKKILVIITTVIFSLFSINYAISTPDTYTSRAILLPVDQESSLSSSLNEYSSIASVAGIAIPKSSSQNNIIEAIERIKSYSFFTRHFLPSIKLENLCAVIKWDPLTNNISYDKKLFNSFTGEWIRDAQPPMTKIPSHQESYEFYKKILHIYKDDKTSFVNISIKHISPNIAKEWINIIIQNINESMRDEDKLTSSKSIEFLNKSYSDIALSGAKVATSKLLEKQIQDLMFISANENYVFKTLEEPIAPEKKSAPNRALMAVLGTILGTIFGVLLSLVHFFMKELK